MKIRVSYYGSFRRFGDGATLDMPPPVKIGDVRNSLALLLGQEQRDLVGDSVLANDTEILPDDYVVGDDCALSILPPVCGG